MAHTLVIDSENTTKNKGHPFSASNKCCLIALAVDNDSPLAVPIEYDLQPYGASLNTVKTFIDLSDTVVGFNLKYDIHWLRRYGLDVSHLSLWDCQIAQFVIQYQTLKYPSLDESCEYWKLGKKLDVVNEQYWSKGIDTPDIPYEVLETYAKQDVSLTRELYNTQIAYLEDKPKLHKLIRLMCYDLKVLAEMEWNGLLYDVEESLKLANEYKARMSEIKHRLDGYVGVDWINWNSGDQVSAVLYGGSITRVVKKPVPFTYKDGRETIKVRNVEEVTKFPRLVEPLKKTELKKAGYFKTSADVLNDLKAKGQTKKMIELLLELADLEKQVGTYLEGIPKLITEMEWKDNIIHGNLNQCVAVTGRLSSNKPNLQNNPASVDKLFRSRYVD